ncbi:hypothetical protein GOP47_0022025 [Adiantum capillus-veneris]|uniref:Uncharacterized protein n=1 Tax=Adiantum capillus-veneris TaxID=13818 RepID=A0A9D4U8L3_ADICA|nr:hypothetical protein GOP47_0022025 [Adiantum capillus-veneris]
MGFDTLIFQKWQDNLANTEGAMDSVKNFCEADIVVVQNKEPVLVDEALVSKALGLTNQGNTKLNKVCPISNEIPRKGTMHQIKDIADAKNKGTYSLLPPECDVHGQNRGHVGQTLQLFEGSRAREKDQLGSSVCRELEQKSQDCHATRGQYWHSCTLFL